MDKTSRKIEKPNSNARVYAYVAREAPVAVILRRGPSRQVCLIRWDLKTDKLEVGQWFKGRIYERRCDLSPDGKNFLYFAANFKEPFYSWTAICNPPFLTAQALWPKGDCWGGGGFFENNAFIRLNHHLDQDKLADDFTLPKKMKVALFGQHSGKGEDSPIYDAILHQGGWKLVQQGNGYFESRNGRWEYKKPSIVSKQSKKNNYELRAILRAIGNKNDAWYWMDYDVLADGELILDLQRTDWADWDHNGDLLFAQDGKLFRIAQPDITAASDNPDIIKEIADLNGLKFEAKPPREVPSP